MADYIDWPGASGKGYRYYFLANTNATSIKNAAGNYMFVKRVPTGWAPVYIGQADDLSARISTHDRLRDAVSAGATRAMAHTTPAGQAFRLAEEQDLIGRWQPVLNTHHKQAK